VSFKDPHEVLGIPRGAGRDDVKRAYKKLAGKFHPDKKGGSAAKFREITEAFNTLKDTPELPNAGPEFIEGDLSATLKLSLEEMIFGCRKSVHVKIDSVKCCSCDGRGAAPGSPMMPCVVCLGTGKAPNVWGFNNSARLCSGCKGAGSTPIQTCKACGGRGKTPGEASGMINVPAGVESGQELSFFGDIGRFRGRMFVRLVGLPHDRFERVGDDLITTCKISIFDAMRGCKLSVTGLDGGQINAAVSPGTQPGECVVVSGAGVRNTMTGRTGDMRVITKVEIPRKMSARAERLMEELADEFTRK